MITWTPHYTPDQKRRMYRSALWNAISTPLMGLLAAYQAYQGFPGGGHWLPWPFNYFAAFISLTFFALTPHFVRKAVKLRRLMRDEND